MDGEFGVELAAVLGGGARLDRVISVITRDLKKFSICNLAIYK